MADAPTPGPQKDSNNHIIMGVIGGLIVLAGLAYGVYWFLHGRFVQSTDNAYLKADLVAMAPRVSGYIEEVYVKDNQQVKAGDPLVRIDVRTYRATLNQQTATVNARNADIAAIESQITQQRSSIEQGKAQLAVASANARFARSEEERFKGLHAQGVETEERYAQAVNQRDVAVAQEQAAAAALHAVEHQVATLESQVNQAKAQVEAAQAAVHTAQLNVDDTIIKAPIDGLIGDNNARVGQFVQPGTRLLSVVPVQNVYLVANYKETQVERMRIGQPAEVHVDALGGDPVQGQIESFAPGTGSQFALLPPENATGNFTKIVQRVPVRIRLTVPPALVGRLLPGMSVTADIDTSKDGAGAGAGQQGK